MGIPLCLKHCKVLGLFTGGKEFRTVGRMKPDFDDERVNES